MPNIIEHKRYVCSSSEENANKFWSYKLFDDDTVSVTYGRVGKTSSTDGPKPMTRKELDRKIREKVEGRGKLGSPSYKAPYKEVIVLAEQHLLPTGPQASSVAVAEAAKAQLAKTDKVLAALVERLVAANKHELHKASGGQLNIDVTTGIISTPVGVVDKGNVVAARSLLDEMAPYVKASNLEDKLYVRLLNDYLMNVPQQVGHARGWNKTFLTDSAGLKKQSTLLDQLEASADLAAARLASAVAGAAGQSIATVPNLFNADLKLVEDGKIIDMITKMFMSNINSSHEASKLRPIKFYSFDQHAANEAFEQDGAKLSNHMLLWHGTRIFNILSIMKSGLILPGSLSTMQIAGAMFGNGLYFSDQSTKSLNYSYGYWDGRARDTNCFMFLFDVAMGKSYTPKSSYESLPKAGFDSTFADTRSGVRNNEMIVYRLGQCRPRYLIEFDEK